MADHYKLRRGDTLQLAGTLTQGGEPFAIDARLITATLQRMDGTRVAPVPVRVLDTAMGEIQLGGTALATGGWAVGMCRLLVQMRTPQADGTEAVQTFGALDVEVLA